MDAYEYIHKLSRRQIRTLRRQADALIETGEPVDGPWIRDLDKQVLEIAQETLDIAQTEQRYYQEVGLDAGDSKDIDFIERMVAYWQTEIEWIQSEGY